MTLDEIQINKPAIIIEVNAQGMLLQKLYDMGFIEGTKIQIIRRSPLNDPIEIEIFSYHISIREKEAKSIKVIYE